MNNTGTTTEAKDICYGPLAPGQFFICRMNDYPSVYKITGVLLENSDSVFICEKWGMNENRWIWSFGKHKNEGGWQVAKCNLEEMERVSELGARHAAEQYLRKQDDEWRARYDPNREPIKIVRCTCGLTDDEPRQRHAMGCSMRGER